MICLYLITCQNLLWRSLMWFLRLLGLIKSRQPAIIAVITLSVHHTFALPTFKQHGGGGGNARVCRASGPKDQRVFGQGGLTMTCFDTV